jgi:parvulin-like peptidyl-prolyl isomerase
MGGAETDPSTVLATVADAPINAGEVGALARATGLSPRDALDRLIAEQLLAREAERRGYAARPEVGAAVERASVRAWLEAEVERAVPASAVTDAEVATTYAMQRARFERPETRTAVHVLLPLDADADESRSAAAQRFAARAIGELRAEGPDVVVARYSANPTGLSGAFHVTAEQVPDLVRGGAFDAAFLDAVFALRAPGVVPEPVRTQFGWHAIAVVAIRPELIVSFERASTTIRRELLAARRGALLTSSLAELAAQRAPRADPQLAARLANIPQESSAPAPRGAP